MILAVITNIIMMMRERREGKEDEKGCVCARVCVRIRLVDVCFQQMSFAFLAPNLHVLKTLLSKKS